jgi:phosphoribosylglycinamide formyltransferase 1
MSAPPPLNDAAPPPDDEVERLPDDAVERPPDGEMSAPPPLNDAAPPPDDAVERLPDDEVERPPDDAVERLPDGGRLPIAVLVSGEGTNLQALIDTVHGKEAMIVGVASSRADVRALQRAAEAEIPTAVFARTGHPDRDSRDAALARWLLERGARMIVLAGYMELLGEAFLERFPRAVINVHPSLLPAFPGLHAIEQALAYGVKVTGVTVHFVDAGVDTGPVIAQRAIELDGSLDVDAVLEDLHAVEHELLAEVVRLAARGALSFDSANPRSVIVSA